MARRDPPPRFSRGRLAGFSLLELTLVLIIVSVLAAVALPRLVTAPTITLPSLAAQVAASIRHTQGLAMSGGQRYRINFTANTYQITDMGGVPVVQPLTGSTAAVSVAPAVLSGYNPPLTGDYVAFDTRGVPYVSATSALAGTATIVLTSGTETASVQVMAETGAVR